MQRSNDIKTKNMKNKVGIIGKKVIFNQYGTLYTGTIIAEREVEIGNFWFDVQKDDKTIVSVSIRNIEKITF